MDEENKVTHARVRYIDSNDISLLEINKIVEFENNPPKNNRDFNNKII